MTRCIHGADIEGGARDGARDGAATAITGRLAHTAKAQAAAIEAAHTAKAHAAATEAATEANPEMAQPICRGHFRGRRQCPGKTAGSRGALGASYLSSVVPVEVRLEHTQFGLTPCPNIPDLVLHHARLGLEHAEPEPERVALVALLR